MPIFYLDYENGNDANDGSSWAQAWKTITLGATAARTAPGDIIRIAKSPAPSLIGNATWTNLSKIVTLASAQNLTIDLCENAWTGTGDTTVARTAVATDAKEGSYCMKLTVDASPQASILQAYFATGELNLSAYQKISFWIKNSGAIVADNWIVCLCSDTAGATTVDSFLVPAIPSTGRWVPLTLTKVGGGNLGASIKSIAIYSGGTTTGMASKYIYVDDFIACTTAGLNLQSLVSKNSLEQGGIEGWYGIQSINGVTVLLDNQTNTRSNEGQGYYGGTGTVTTYKRETIKTDLLPTVAGVHIINESGTAGNNIEYQGGYNVSTTEQDGETFFDGLNERGYGLYFLNKDYITVNRLNFSRYTTGIYLHTDSENNTFTNITNISNCSTGIHFNDGADENTIVTLGNVNNNSTGILIQTSVWNTITTVGNINNNTQGINVYTSNQNRIVTVSSVCNNASYGIYFNSSSYGNYFDTISNVNSNGQGIYFVASQNNVFNVISNTNNNGGYAVYFATTCERNIIGTISTTGNTTGGIYSGSGRNYIHKATIAEGTPVSTVFTAYLDEKLFINNLNGYSNIQCSYGNIVSQDATAGGTGLEWKMSPTNSIRNIFYPLTLSIAKIAVIANKLVTVKAYYKKSHATDLEAKLVCRGGQIAGVVSDVTDTCPSDTARNQLTITFTPTEIGVVEIEAWAYWLANVADENVIIDDMIITQAD